MWINVNIASGLNISSRIQHTLMYARTLATSTSRSALRNAPSLEEFMFQRKVKGIYRLVLRQIYKHHERDDLVRFIRDEFKTNSTQRDLQHRKYLLSQGINQINQMSASLGLNVRV
ncbi:uncharacterized protein LODBEIA_P29410 [Lodderomyces beijingensis]|uniref:Complex 1 LYR protein domain-containing protein n=1 Tax=Lodderomyces beijingensis TaxID=1775926 RepID=A0ABP0ZR63_9ASCO